MGADSILVFGVCVYLCVVFLFLGKLDIFKGYIGLSNMRI